MAFDPEIQREVIYKEHNKIKSICEANWYTDLSELTGLKGRGGLVTEKSVQVSLTFTLYILLFTLTYVRQAGFLAIFLASGKQKNAELLSFGLSFEFFFLSFEFFLEFFSFEFFPAISIQNFMLLQCYSACLRDMP